MTAGSHRRTPAGDRQPEDIDRVYVYIPCMYRNRECAFGAHRPGRFEDSLVVCAAAAIGPDSGGRTA